MANIVSGNENSIIKFDNYCVQVARNYDERILIGGDATDCRNTLAHVAAYRGDPELFKVSY